MQELAFLLLSPLFVFGLPQAERTISDAVSCPSCTVVIGERHLLLKGDEPLSGFIGKASGSFLVSSSKGVPQRFDTTGLYLGPLGRPGAGPGEFRMAAGYAAGPGGAFSVYDAANGRLELFGPEGQRAGSVRLTHATIGGGVLWLGGDDAFIVSGQRPDAEHFGYTLHVYSQAGTYRRSFAPTAQPILPGGSKLAGLRLVSQAPDGGLLVVSVVDRYTVQRWNPASDSLEQTWVRDAPWFGRVEGPFQPRILSAVVDSAGLLWTLALVPSPSWEKGVRARDLAEGIRRERTYEIVDRDLIADTMIEVIDLRQARVVARRRLDRLYATLLPGGLVAAERAEDGGVEVFPVRLAGLPRVPNRR